MNWCDPSDLRKSITPSSQDVKRIASCTSLLLLCKVGIPDYKKLLHDNVTANYQITDANNVKQINLDAKNIANTLKLDNRIKKFAKKGGILNSKRSQTKFLQ